MLFYLPIIITVLSNVFYHIFLKVTPAGVNPLLTLAITYFSAGVICLAGIRFVPLGGGLVASLKQLNWASYALAFTIVGLEVGFLLAYRRGWDISMAAVVSNTIVGIILIPVGLLIFREQISLTNLVGIVLCVAGLILVNIK